MSWASLAGLCAAFCYLMASFTWPGTSAGPTPNVPETTLPADQVLDLINGDTMINENTRDHRQMRARGGRFGASLVAGTLVALALACGGAWAQSTPESASLTRRTPTNSGSAIWWWPITYWPTSRCWMASGTSASGRSGTRSTSTCRDALAPALVTVDDIMEFDENSEPVNPQGRSMYGERYIHGEIFRSRPDVNAVVHSHSPQVVPFSVTKTPFQAVVHMAAFLGAAPAPVFEIRDVLGPDNDMLVRDTTTGAALARVLGARSVVLMRGHGMAVVAASVRMVVMRAVYTQLNAQIEAEALKLGAPIFMTPRRPLAPIRRIALGKSGLRKPSGGSPAAR